MPHRDERDAFHDQLLALLPTLRGHALRMAWSRADADDLVQSAIVNALAARDSFTPGTSFGGWMYRILRNLFIYESRRRSRTCNLDEMPDEHLAHPPMQFEHLVLKQLRRDLARLPGELREAVALVAVEALPYGTAAGIAGCPVGTMKSRVNRARHRLDVWLSGEEALRHSDGDAEGR
jgi:RNA polymerase sigma-70 factor (ECF subfamily)